MSIVGSLKLSRLPSAKTPGELRPDFLSVDELELEVQLDAKLETAATPWYTGAGAGGGGTRGRPRLGGGGGGSGTSIGMFRMFLFWITIDEPVAAVGIYRSARAWRNNRVVLEELTAEGTEGVIEVDEG